MVHGGIISPVAPPYVAGLTFTRHVGRGYQGFTVLQSRSGFLHVFFQGRLIEPDFLGGFDIDQL